MNKMKKVKQVLNTTLLSEKYLKPTKLNTQILFKTNWSYNKAAQEASEYQKLCKQGFKQINTTKQTKFRYICIYVYT